MRLQPARLAVYRVVTCADQRQPEAGTLKRSSTAKARALHWRFFQFFDVDRAVLIDVDKLGKPRRIDRMAFESYAASFAPAPLAVPDAAAV